MYGVVTAGPMLMLGAVKQGVKLVVNDGDRMAGRGLVQGTPRLGASRRTPRRGLTRRHAKRT